MRFQALIRIAFLSASARNGGQGHTPVFEILKIFPEGKNVQNFGFVYTNPMLGKLLPFELGVVEILRDVSDNVKRA